MRFPLVAICGWALGCGPAGRSSTVAPVGLQPAASSEVTAPSVCSPALDVRALLAHHERAFGRHDDLLRSLPGFTTGTRTRGAATGPHALFLDRDGHRVEEVVGSLLWSEGQHPTTGVWGVGAAHGVRESLAGQEAAEVALTPWLWRREYAAVDPARVSVSCPAGTTSAVLRFGRPDLGDPALSFELATARLLSVEQTEADGKPLRIAIDAWSPPDRGGVRWPTALTTTTASGSSSTLTLDPIMSGRTCVHLGKRGERIDATGPACLEPAPSRTKVRWPASGVVRVPMTFLKGQIMLRVQVRGRDAWALLDSGAGITVLEASSPAAAAFVSDVQVQGHGSTQAIRLGVGELAEVDIGDLHVTEVPTASTPIPALSAFGDRRPEIILGYTFFALGAVRIDYARGEVAFASRAQDLVGDARGAGAPRPVPMSALGGKFIAEAMVEGSKASFQLDTGNSGALSLTAPWARAHGLPGERAQASVRGRFGAGEQETEEVMFRVQRASFGPIQYDDGLADAGAGAGLGSLAGLLGNRLLSRCDAVTFDHARRTLWLEGSCARPESQASFGWRLAHTDDTSLADRPWVIGALIGRGPAEQAGLRVGDRLVEVGGRPATPDVRQLQQVEQQPEGTRVPVVVVRDGKRQRFVVVLRALLRS